MARRTPQSRFDIAHLLPNHASIEHGNGNQFCSEDDTSIRVENRGIGFAAKRSVGERGDVRVRADWRNGGSEWGLRTCLLQPWFVATRSNSSKLHRFPLDLCAISNMFFFFFFKFSFNYENYYKKSQNGVVLIT